MTDLTTLVPQLKRSVATPGAFAATFPGTLDTDLLGSLADAFGRAQLLGFLPTSTIDAAFQIVTPDLTPAAASLVVLYAAERILTMRLLDLNQRATYEAGRTKYETEKAASTLTGVLKGIQAEREELIKLAVGAGRTRGGFAMADQYVDRLTYPNYPDGRVI